MPQKVRKHKPRAVIDTSVLVAGKSGFREPFVPGRNPSADGLHWWAERNNFIWLINAPEVDFGARVFAGSQVGCLRSFARP